MSTAHTPTPWSARGLSGTAIFAADDQMIASVYGDDPDCRLDERVLANVEFIVRACNSHDQLLAALKAAQEFVVWSDGGGGATRVQVEAALKAAGAA